MQQEDDNSEVREDETNASIEDKAGNIEDWRNEHGQPSFEYLQSLVEDGSTMAIEKLRSIAEDLNVKYSSDTPVEDLVREIRSSARNDPTTTT